MLAVLAAPGSASNSWSAEKVPPGFLRRPPVCSPPLRPALAAPCPPRRALVPLTPAKPCVTKGKFTLLSYNLLADLYATVRPGAHSH